MLPTVQWQHFSQIGIASNWVAQRLSTALREAFFQRCDSTIKLNGFIAAEVEA